jgi:hypothetical protein
MAAFPWFRSVLVTGFAAYAIALATHVGAFAAGSDSSGYFNNARLLDSGHVTTPIRRSASIPPDAVPEHAYIPLGFRPISSNAMVPTYPIGLPLAAVAAARVIGWGAAPDVTLVVHALAGVVLVFWLALECGLSPALAALGALLLASSPLYLFSSLQFMSDVPALVWTTLAVLLAWRGRSRSACWTALAGLALTFAVLVRPTNVLALAPIAVCIGLSYRRWLWFMLGALPGMVLFLLYNQAAYGNPLTTGYGDVGGQFSVSYVLPTLLYYGAWLPVFLTPICVLALAVPMILRRNPPLIFMLSVWILVFLGFYSFYVHTHDMWSSVRFLLPAFPPVIVGSLWVARVAIERSSRISWSWIAGHHWAAVATLAGVIFIYNAAWSRRLYVLDVGNGDRSAFDTTEWTKSHLPPDATILAMQLSGAFFYYTQFPVLRYDDFTAEGLRRLEAAAAAHGAPLYAVLVPFERERLAATLTDRSVGTWRLVGEVGTSTVWRFRGNSRN